MYRRYGQDCCSRQILNSCIHVGNDAVPEVVVSGNAIEENLWPASINSLAYL